MPLIQKKMIVVNCLLFSLSKVAVCCVNYQRIAFYFGTPWRMASACTVLSAAQIKQAKLIQQIIAQTVANLPWQCNCLVQALVAKWWCQYYQLPYMLFIGFAKGANQPLGKLGHAWIMAGPIALTGGDCMQSHHIVLSYSNLTLLEA